MQCTKMGAQAEKLTKINKIRPKKARNLNILGLLESKREHNYPQIELGWGA